MGLIATGRDPLPTERMSGIPMLRAAHEQSVELNRTRNERAAPCSPRLLKVQSSLFIHPVDLPKDALDRLQNDMAIFRQRIGLALQRSQAIVHLTQKLLHLRCSDADLR